MSLTTLIAGLVVIDLFVVVIVLGLARSSARADARAVREIEDWYEHHPRPRPQAVTPPQPGRPVTPYPGRRERPDPSGARAASARSRPQR
jgi:hypothetical protein